MALTINLVGRVDLINIITYWFDPQVASDKDGNPIITALFDFKEVGSAGAIFEGYKH